MQAIDHHIAKDGFRLRGIQMSRVDGFSDVVFGFALTLLVVSLEVPHTFQQLNESLRGFIPFAICFTLLLLIWYSHYKFFRRFGLHDTMTIVLNAVLLFVVLYYVYPLKFLFTVITTGWISQDNSVFGTVGQMREVMLLYGIGFTAVYVLFMALYWNAFRQKRDLHLTPCEEFLTRSSIVEYASMGCVGLLSTLFAFFAPPHLSGAAGFFYMGLWVVGPIHGTWERRNLKRFPQSGTLSLSVTLKVHGIR